jgi:hypothetical protein
MKALSKEPERRYGSPLELEQELTRYLEHEPVLAGPPSAGYRLKKFFRRHRTQSIIARSANQKRFGRETGPTCCTRSRSPSMAVASIKTR